MVEKPRSRATSAPDPLATVEPLPVTRRADLVVERIRDLIVDDLLSVGDRLPAERQLAARFGTSRAIVAQALRTLSLMGLVEIRPGSGVYVTRNPGEMLDHSVELLVRSNGGDPRDLAELRKVLEDAAATSALAEPSKVDVTEMRETLGRMSQARGRLSTWVIADTHFHATLVHAGGNPYLSAIYDSVHTAVISVTYDEWVSRDTPPRWFTQDFDAQLELHASLLQAVEVGDAVETLRALATHHAALLEHLGHRR